MSAVIWVHADALSATHRVFGEAPEDVRAVFVWDADELARRDWSLKRCVFVLECLAEMDVELLEGEPAAVLDGLQAERIYAATSPDPYIRGVLDALDTPVTRVAETRFADVPDGADLKRFFRYWNKAKKTALKPSQTDGDRTA